MATIGEILELDALFVQRAHQIDQVLDAAAKPIQLPYHQGITLAQHFQCLGQAGTLGAVALIFPSKRF